MEITEKLPEKEMLRRRIVSNARNPRHFCPYKEPCFHQCYKFFTRWERFRFIINFMLCPCDVLPVEKVKKRTWDWINRAE
jgi:hypothetical protein